jgi:succinate-acetate transporter protein
VLWFKKKKNQYDKEVYSGEAIEDYIKKNCQNIQNSIYSCPAGIFGFAYTDFILTFLASNRFNREREFVIYERTVHLAGMINACAHVEPIDDEFSSLVINVFTVFYSKYNIEEAIRFQVALLHLVLNFILNIDVDIIDAQKEISNIIQRSG